MNCDAWRYKTMVGMKNIDIDSAALNYGQQIRYMLLLAVSWQCCEGAIVMLNTIK